MSEHSFLGSGWSFPPTFVKGLNQVIITENDANINENLHILFSTSIGERIMAFKYGTKLKRLVFSSLNSTLIGEIEDTISNAILFYEPRIKLTAIEIDQSDYNQGTLYIKLDYIVRTTNSRSNFVYPFYITEGTNL